MRYTLTILEKDFKVLQEHLKKTTNEAAAYILARLSITKNETRILVRTVMPVAEVDVESSSSFSMSIRSSSYVKAIKSSLRSESIFGYIHSHPIGPETYSAQDDLEERILFRLAHDRNPKPLHVSLLITSQEEIIGRVWLPDGRFVPLERIRILGDRWRFIIQSHDSEQVPEFFDRQVRAFGADIQQILGRLFVGVVGAGGTGSAICEQLIRLGIGKLMVIDHDRFSASNVNRVYGSSSFDQGIQKTQLIERLSAHIGMGTLVTGLASHLGIRSVAEQLRECDLVFGCTDDQWGRSILCRLAIYYYIPVCDMAVAIDPKGEQIRSVRGRLTMLLPDAACLFCRNRITTEGVTSESIAATDPARADQLAEEGYIQGVDAPAPAVIAFTSSIAAAAVGELLARLTGFKGREPRPTELVYLFDQDAIGKNSMKTREHCFCSNRKLFGIGDTKPFLGLTWMAES